MNFILWLFSTVVGGLIGCAIGHLVWNFIDRR